MSLSTRTSLAERDHVELYEKNGSSRVKWWHAIFFFSGISVLCCLCQLFLPYPYGLMMTSTQIAEVGIAPGCGGGLERCICPRETICATDTLSIILLALARCSAFFDYPLYMMMFLSKCHNINNVCRRTVLREWIDFGDMHKVHRLFGIIVGIETMFHSFFHMLRWGLNADIGLLWRTTTGISGLVATIITPLICWPMVIPAIKERLAFEVRKGLHYLSIVWAITLLFHSTSMIYYLIGIPALMYLVDYLFGYFVRNSLIENAFFERYGENGVALHFLNPPNWDKKPKTSYVYVMCPWISKYQWHAFTIFPEPTKENHTMMCIENSGDWTKELHKKIRVPCLRPLYVLGPYKSPFSDAAVTTSNAIAVASGIGITPTLSLVLNYAGKKRINVVWVCRDPGLVEYILHKFDIGAVTEKSYAFIFYTGTRELAMPKDLPANIFIFTGRPHLEHTITGIVTAIHSGHGLPEEIYEAQEKIASAPFDQRMKIALSRVVEIYNKDEMFEYAVEETEKAAAAAVSKAQVLESRNGTVDTAPLDDSDPETAPLLFPPDEVPEGQVSLIGLDSMIYEFLGGIGEYSRSDIEALFHEIDSDGSGFIDRDEFDDFIGMITTESRTLSNSQHELLSAMERSMDVRRSSIDSSVHRSTHNNILGNDTTIRYMQNLLKYSEGDNPLEDWSIFYCGGSNEIAQILREVTSKYNIDFAVEKFDW
ncbi:NADPH oxidase [Skeletonema marinoi]|uniref:NADPH oxidase n=1 Tax=Skeletonema marinoi TaxID=267567 RepID=A0AAD9D7L9_9STRA|nr:NADPH oxidase [Skeletonema marinoi]